MNKINMLQLFCPLYPPFLSLSEDIKYGGIFYRGGENHFWWAEVGSRWPARAARWTRAPRSATAQAAHNCVRSDEIAEAHQQPHGDVRPVPRTRLHAGGGVRGGGLQPQSRLRVAAGRKCKGSGTDRRDEGEHRPEHDRERRGCDKKPARPRAHCSRHGEDRWRVGDQRRPRLLGLDRQAQRDDHRQGRGSSRPHDHTRGGDVG